MTHLIDVLEKYHDFINILEDYSKQELPFDEKWELFVFKSTRKLNDMGYYDDFNNDFLLAITDFLLNYSFCDDITIIFVDCVQELSELIISPKWINLEFECDILQHFNISKSDVLQKYKEAILESGFGGIIYYD